MNLRSSCLVVLLSTTGAGSQVDWSRSLETAMRDAKANASVVFVAINMDGERANDRLAREVYRNERIVELSTYTRNVVGSVFEHDAGEKECPRFGQIQCAEHIDTEASLRAKRILHAGEEGVVAPQHAFLDSEGELILSVPYAITTGELEWCFVTAIRRSDPEFEWTFSSTSRAPKRLVMKGMPAPTAVYTAPLLSREQMLEVIDKLNRKTLRGEGRRKGIHDLMRSDEVEAIEFVERLLRAGPMGRRGKDYRTRHLHDIGALSPPSFWEIVAQFADSGERAIRQYAVVALEQLAAPDSVKTIRSALSREKDPTIEKDLLRAMASAGASDDRVRRDVLKRCKKEKDQLVRVNAVIALGHLVPGDDVRQLLVDLSSDEDTEIRIAAVCAMAMTREAEWVETLRSMLANATDGELRTAIQASLAVYQLGDLAPLRGPLMRVAHDEIGRPRFFGGD